MWTSFIKGPLEEASREAKRASGRDVFFFLCALGPGLIWWRWLVGSLGVMHCALALSFFPYRVLSCVIWPYHGSFLTFCSKIFMITMQSFFSTCWPSYYRGSLSYPGTFRYISVCYTLLPRHHCTLCTKLYIYFLILLCAAISLYHIATTVLIPSLGPSPRVGLYGFNCFYLWPSAIFIHCL